MVRFCHAVCAALVALLPVQGAEAQAPAADAASAGVRLLTITHEMWYLLSGVVDKASADAAAPRFRELVIQSGEMSEKLFDEDSQAQDVEVLEQDTTYRFAETYEDLSFEFESLCRARCFGSTQLISAFLEGMRLGVFSDDGAEQLRMTSIVLSDKEALSEIARLKNLEVPDREILRILSTVKDSGSAGLAAAELSAMVNRLRRYLPENRFQVGNFPEKKRAALARACGALEPLLWKIRCEIVRIVSLPGYDDDRFDSFSDALDSVFESLSDTHSECFDGIFDESFRSDLDDALHESITSSQR